MIFNQKITLEFFLGYVKNFIYRIYRIKFDNILLFQLFPISAYTIIAYIYYVIRKYFISIYVLKIIQYDETRRNFIRDLFSRNTT